MIQKIIKLRCLLLLTFGIILFMACNKKVNSISSLNSNEKNTFIYQYTDGNNNTYKCSYNYIVYEPISVNNSSSGIYSGGSYKKCKIKDEDWNNLTLLFESVLSKKSIHLDARFMGCGTIIKLQNDNVLEKCFIPMNSDEQSEIEALLIKLTE